METSEKSFEEVRLEHLRKQYAFGAKKYIFMSNEGFLISEKEVE